MKAFIMISTHLKKYDLSLVCKLMFRMKYNLAEFHKI